MGRQTKHINTAIDDDNNLIFNIRDAVLDKPAPPAGPLEYQDVQATSLLLNWRMPSEDGGSPTTNYVVLMKEREAESWRCIADTVVRTTLNVKKLKRGATYLFKVFAENRFGKSEPLVGAPCKVEFPFKRPGAPGIPKATHISREMVMLKWDEPMSDGGDKITAYHIEKKERNNLIWQKATHMPIRDRHVTLKALGDGLEFEFRVT